MPAVKTKRISTLIETQLPQFISSEYELFSKFVQKYYEAQEVQGGTLDIISNIQKYADIDFYEKSILKQNDTLAASITDSDTTIVLQDAQSFPLKNGYVRIDDEIIFYAKRTDTELLDCSRGISGNTTLGDLYNESNFVSTEAAAHVSGQTVYNVSNLFLYALVRNFENQYLGSFPEKYLKGEVDKRTLIKNIQKFYKAKGTSSSIKFIFNTIVAKEADNKPDVYKPKDYTYKSSNADWINIYALKCKVISGNINSLVGNPLVQNPTDEYGYASATVDSVYADGTRDGEQIYNIVVAPETVNGEFFVSTKTKLTKSLSGIASTGSRIDVFSTIGWGKKGSILIGNETITFDKKTATQFIIKNRQPSGAVVHAVNTPVYKPVIISGSGVSLLVLGIIYNMTPTDPQPYSDIGDAIQVSNPGFITADPKIVRAGTNQTRWILGNGSPVLIPTLPTVASSLNEVPTDVTSIYEDEQYYYITSSSFPSHRILDGSSVNNETLLDQEILRLIRKEAITTTERYKTPKTDTGILLNGVRTYSYRDSESIRFGKLVEIKVDLQGRGYNKPPFVLVDGVPNKARAVLSGQVVERIIVDTLDIFPNTPEVTITSGRRAEVRAIVTGGRVTSLVIDNPGEYYSSPPLVRIRDNAGRGRFANYESIVDGDGKLVGFEKIDEGNFYNQNTVIVDIIPIGEGAVGIPLLREWNFNRYEKLKDDLDTENGYIFQNFNQELEFGYGYIANPKALRVALGDNLNNAGSEPTNKIHSPIIGFAYDGNPIYGPFGHENPLDSQSPIVRMTSGYSIKNSRSEGPSVKKYPLGSFVDDYQYIHRSGSLDENNGRFCITPEYPEGTYAYFLTIDSNQVPKFPYIIGANFYSLPIDSNYNSNINQNDIPKNAKRYYTPGIPRNGEGLIASISDVSSGTIDNVNIVRSSNNFSVNSKVYFDNKGTGGSEIESNVSSVKGKSVNYLQSKETKVVKLTTIQTAYLFSDDTLRQPSSGANGKIVGTVANDNVIVLRDVNGTFDNTGTFSADIKTFSVLLDQDSSYTEGAILSLTDGENPPIATAEVLEGTNRQNVVKIKVLSGVWIIDDNYFIQSDNLFNTVGSRIITLTSLSDNLEPFDVNQSVALVETNSSHGLGIGDKVVIDINPDDTTKTKTYYLRKRLYQEATLISPKVERKISYTGIGRYQILNGGYDYTPGVYNNVPLTGGSGTGATASITVSNDGIVSSITLQTGGSGYRKADYLSVDDESLIRSIASLGNQRLIIYVDHVGFAAGSTRLIADSGLGFAEGDLISIGEEVLEISSISSNVLTVLRGREGTVDKDHYDGQAISLFKPRYNFTPNFQIFSGNGSGYIQSYDRNTQKIIVVYDYTTSISSANELTLSSSFFDSSVPVRPVNLRFAGDLQYKFEFSDDNTNFVPNPNINIQEFYRYLFDTSHSSLTGTYFDMSPSRSYNLETLEKKSSIILPGNPGSFTEVKFGFGATLASNNYQNKVGTKFANFYYFDRKGIVNSDGSFFKIISDPLQGTKTVNYVTPNRFVYDVTSEPLWDGSGSISYTTTGQFAIGEIDGFSITNLGLNYRKVPVVIGVDPNPDYKATATVLYDLLTKTISEVRIDNKGSNYVNPKVVITKSDGVDATFDIVVRNGEIFSITVKNPGYGYTFAPEIEIVEGDVEAYAESKTVGVPRSVSIINNGGSYHLDKTVSSTFNSKFVFSLSNFNGDFRKGEQVVQVIDGVEVAKAKVSEWRFGSNLLKVENVIGIFRENETIRSVSTPTSGTIKSVFVSTFTEEIVGFYDNIGYFKSDRGKIGVSNQKIVDSFFYQDYSYVVKSKTPIDQWRDLIKSTTHPAGFKLFGQVDIEATAGVEMPVEVPKASHFSVIQLWDPAKNKITVENTRRVITQTIQKVENQRIRRGVGSSATSEFLFNELRAFEVSLDAEFDGYYDSDGRRQGTTSFQLRNDLGQAFTPYSDKNLIITLDGILQEPGVAYTISGDRIVFSQPPLGPYQKQTGESQADVTKYKGVKFYGKYIAFKDNQYNAKHFKKIRNIFQRNGRWLDAANQVERNKKFIVEETIGYAKQAHPLLDWSTKQDDYEVNIGSILDAYEHDLRFGGNIKTVDYTSIFNDSSDYLYIQNNRSQSADIFNYATRLTKLAIRNWDYVDISVSYIQGSNIMNVTDTSNVAIGMFVSSGRAYPSGTYIVSIDSDTQVTLNNVALANSAGGGGAPAGTTLVSGVATGGTSPTNTIAVSPGNIYSVPPGITVTTPTSFSGTDQATFFWSGVNNGTFYDASRLIEGNKTYIQQQTLAWAQTTYPSINWNSKGSKCERDLGFLVDAYVYHLRFGGNRKVVEFGQFYYDKAKYPDGENLLFVNNELTESLAAFEYAKDLMVQAMRNSLPYTDPSILVDPQSPVCIEVESALDNFNSIVNTILSEGRGLVEISEQNPNKQGNWSRTLTYSDYNITADPLLISQECNDVISSVNLLFDSVSDILQKKSIARSLPDYIDGETKVFELYWEDGSDVILEEDEDLFLTINAVLQRPKYTENYPLFDAYYIDREVIPNQIKFDVAPIWDQDFGAKSIGEPTAVEKISGIGVGNYKRLTIDYELVNGIRSGPFLILDVEDYTVQNVESKDNLYVFLDGVLQREGYSYTVSGPNIYFNVPILEEMKIDIRYLYGRNVGQVLNIYDFSPDTYYSRGLLTITGVPTNIILEYSVYKWMQDKIGSAIHVWQKRPNGTSNIIGEISNFFRSGNTITFDLKGQNSYIENGLDLIFSVAGRYESLKYVITDTNFSSASITFNTDEYGRKLLRNDDAIWYGTIIGKSYRNPFVYLSRGDKIRVQGEDQFRSIKQLPEIVTSKDGRNGEQLSDDIYGTVSIESYTGVTRGEGLSVIAKVENGTIVSLEWNQRSYNPLTQPTAYQYFTPPILKFIPANGQGGGARANVLVSKGQVISVDLLDGGSGYTEAPLVVVSRRYDILTERDIGVSIINVGINPYVETAGITVTSTIDLISFPEALSFASSAVIIDSPARVDWELEEELNLRVENKAVGVVETRILSSRPNPDGIAIIDIFAQTNQYVSQVSGRVADIISNSIVTASRQITSTLSEVINNTALSNINFYEVGAYLDVDLDIFDTTVYIADTSKFKTSGYLLIGDEVVRYYRKINDRFLKVQRGEQNTTPKNWAAGTFLRQIPDPISIVPGGVVVVESESAISTVSASTTSREVERKTQRQITSPSFSFAEPTKEILGTLNVAPIENTDIQISFFAGVITIESGFDITAASISSTIEVDLQQVTSIEDSLIVSKEIIVKPPETGAIDRYVEEVFFAAEVVQRNGTIVVLSDKSVLQRSGVVVSINNFTFILGQVDLRGDYALAKLGPSIGNFADVFVDVGTINASGIAIGDMEIYFPALTIGDFTDRASSSYMKSGRYFNMVRPSTNNPVTITTYTGTVPSVLTVQNTDYFPNSGYLFTSGGTVIRYTSKSSVTFNGCVLYSGPNSISNGNQLVPFSIN